MWHWPMSGVIRQVINGAIILGISKSAFAGPHLEVRVQRSVLVQVSYALSKPDDNLPHYQRRSESHRRKLSLNIYHNNGTLSSRLSIPYRCRGDVEEGLPTETF